MKKKHSQLSLFIVCIIVIFLLFVFSRVPFFNPVFSLVGQLLIPIQSTFYGVFQGAAASESSQIKNLQEKNILLSKQLADKSEIQKEINALRDQFQTQNVAHRSLMPAKIIGAPGFVPGIVPPHAFIIDKGIKDGVKLNSAVIYKDVLVGKITKLGETSAEVTLLTRKAISFTAKTAKTNAQGVVRGNDADVFIDHVVLSEKLEKGDIVVTRGDRDEKGNGFVPNLVIGEIISVDKKPSALFQSARIKIPIDPVKLSTVFIMGN